MSNPSRTLSLPKNVSSTLTLTEELLSSVIVTGGDKFTYYICENLELANKLETFFVTNNVKPNRSTYSLFFRFSNPNNISTDDIHRNLLTYVRNLLSNVNVTYSRVDDSSNTGKLCVDLYDNYMKLKALNENSEFRFFAFNPRRNQNSNNNRSDSNTRFNHQRSYHNGQSTRGSRYNQSTRGSTHEMSRGSTHGMSRGGQRSNNRN